MVSTQYSLGDRQADRQQLDRLKLWTGLDWTGWKCGAESVDRWTGNAAETLYTNLKLLAIHTFIH